MDTTDCPPGLASDNVMLYGNDFIRNSCDVSIAVFCVIFGIMSVVRTSIALFQLHVWRVRERNFELRAGKRRKRFPIFPIVSVIQAILLILFTVLTALNITNASNAGTGIILCLYYFPMSITAIVVAQRLVRLGKRLIPAGPKSLASNSSDDSTSYLAHADGFLKACFYISTICVALNIVSMVITGPIIPVYATYQIGAACLMAQDILFGAGVAYQYQRLIQAVNKNRFQGENIMSGQETQRQQIGGVVHKMQTQQLLFALMGTLASIVWLLNIARIVLPYYWYVTFHYGVEIVFTFFSAMSLATRNPRAKPPAPASTGLTVDNKGSSMHIVGNDVQRTPILLASPRFQSIVS